MRVCDASEGRCNVKALACLKESRKQHYPRVSSARQCSRLRATTPGKEGGTLTSATGVRERQSLIDEKRRVTESALPAFAFENTRQTVKPSAGKTAAARD